MSYDNNNRGAIWGNDRKEKDTHPDFKGQATIDGVEYWVSAWKRKADANPKAPSLSFSFERKEAEARRSTESAPPTYSDNVARSHADNDIPF